MKKFKFIPMAAAVAVAGTSIATAANVLAYGPVDRMVYTNEDITTPGTAAYKALVEEKKIIFNSIKDNPDGDERNFVKARAEGDNGLWHSNEITVESGKTYDITMYIHNNSPLGTGAIAKDVHATYALDLGYGSELNVEGYIDATNASPSQYWDYVTFKSANGQNFYLDYVEGSATVEYNEVDANGNITKKDVVKSISDKVITKSGVSIGDMPGCYAYSKYVNIKVRPVFTDGNFTVEKTVRKAGDKTWVESVDAKVGDKVEYNIHYKNTTEGAVENVMFKDVLPTNLKIVGDVKLYNATNPNGLVEPGDIVKDGINIGGYAVNGDAYIRFTAEVIDNNLICGKNTLRNWGQIGVGKITLQDSADVVVQKTCTEEEEKTSMPSALPKTGPEAIAAGVIGVGSIVTAAGYYVASRKQLR